MDKELCPMTHTRGTTLDLARGSAGRPQTPL